MASGGGSGGGLGGSGIGTTIERLAALQNSIKRDPLAYVDEFKLQHAHYEAQLAIFKLRPSTTAPEETETFTALVNFLSHVSGVYKNSLAAFPGEITALLQQHGEVLAMDVRHSLAQALILMRNKGLVEIVSTTKTFFGLLRLRDKHLRELLVNHIVHDIRNVNREKRDDTTNRALQAFLYSMLADDSLIAAKKSLDVLVELYRRQVWTDARTVNVMATAVTSKRPKLMVTALKFFLGVGNGIGGGEEADEDDDIDDDELPPNLDPKQVREALANHSHSKHTKRRARQTARMLAGMKKGAKRAAERAVTVFPAIQLLHDPQGLAEKVFSMLRSSKERFEVRLMQMNFVSRLIGQHRLLLLPFYSFVQRYLAAHQSHVTQVLAYLIQACHDLVPPDEILPVIRGICNNFITDRNTPEVIQVGLNAVREIIAHCPVVLEEEGMRDLVSDLVLYRKYKNKGVVSAARAVLNLIREIYPAILRRRDWGKDVATSDGAQSARPTSYGYQRVATGVEGADLLALALALKAQKRAARAAAGAGVEHDSDADSDSDMEGDYASARGSDALGSHTSSAAVAAIVSPHAIAAAEDDDEWAVLERARARELRKKGKTVSTKLIKTKTGKRGGASSDTDSDLSDLDDLLGSDDEEEEEEGHGHGHGHVHGEHCNHDHDHHHHHDSDEEEEEEEESEDDEDEEFEEDDDDDDDDEESEEEESEEEVQVAGAKRRRGFTAPMDALAKRGNKRSRHEEEEEESEEEESDAEEEESDAEEEESDAEEEESDAEEEDVHLHDGASSAGAGTVSSKQSRKSALAASVLPMLKSQASGMQLEATRFLTPKDFERIRKLREKLADKGLENATAADLLKHLKNGGSLNLDDDAAKSSVKKKRRGGRNLGLADDEVPDSSDSEDDVNQLAMPGTTYMPAVAMVDPTELEADGTRKKRRAAERLVDALDQKQAKYEGKKSGGGTTNKEKARKKNYLMLRKSTVVQEKMKQTLVAQQRAVKSRLAKKNNLDKRKKQRRRRT